MSTWTAYLGDTYLNWSEMEDWCRDAARSHPDWVTLETVGQSRMGRPLFLFKVGVQDADLDRRPGFWLDGGTHAAEWTGVMSALYTVSKWLQALADGDPKEVEFFSGHTAYIMPCISPDGYQLLFDGAPFLRSTLRPSPNEAPRIGLDPHDLTGDGVVRWMRWKDPAGPYVTDPDLPVYMRPRTLEDDPGDAYFFCQEGTFLNWDGAQWIQATRQYGLDLNRNFPAHWAPFSMFGMDGGAYPMSEPESRAVVDTFTSFPYIGAALTNHTYTGCILTQPYREDTPLPQNDIKLMARLAKDAVEGTGYAVYKTYPEFSYDKKKSVVGVWSDTLSTTFGVPGYTLELWDPFTFAGVEDHKPVEFFTHPDPAVIRQVVGAFSEIHGTVIPWEPYEHPQLGPVEIGGLDYMRTVRNPPESHLPQECERGHTVACRLRRAVPSPHVSVTARRESDELSRIEMVIENRGFLSTAGLSHGESLPGTPAVRAALTPSDDIDLVVGQQEQDLGHMDGWGSFAPGGLHSVYPHLGERGHRRVAEWWVRGQGEVTIEWVSGRAGRGRATVQVG